MYCNDTKYLSGAMPQSEYPFCVQNVDALNQRDAQWSEIKEYLAQDENRNKLDVILGFVPDEESDKTLIEHSADVLLCPAKSRIDKAREFQENKR